jgi:hypothetical protein
MFCLRLLCFLAILCHLQLQCKIMKIIDAKDKLKKVTGGLVNAAVAEANNTHKYNKNTRELPTI